MKKLLEKVCDVCNMAREQGVDIDAQCDEIAREIMRQSRNANREAVRKVLASRMPKPISERAQ